MAAVNDDDSGDVPEGAVEYDCTPWAGETRRILRSVLDDRAVPQVWEGTVLVVPAQFEDVVDQVIDEVSITSKPSLGRSRATVGYDLSPWSAGSLNHLVDLLVERAVPHEWDAEGDLVVHEEDAELAEELIATLGDPDGSGEMDGVELHDHLGGLFVAADRLARDPGDASGLGELEVHHRAIEDVAVPFGIEASTWLELNRLAAELRNPSSPGGTAGDGNGGDGTGGDDTDGDEGDGDEGGGDEGGGDDAVVGAPDRARALRDLLRTMV